MDKYIQIGSTKKAHGTKGELKMHIEETYLEDFLQAQILFLEIAGKRVPFFIEAIRFGNAPIAKFEDVSSKEEALRFTAKKIFMRERDLLPEQARQLEVAGLEFEKFTGFQIITPEDGIIGIIKEVVEYPQQEMAMVDYNGREILIPLHENLIAEIQNTEKQLTMNLPEGLLEL